MAVELGLNRFLAKPPTNETEFQLLERRNRERTYLVLFVHDRSLSMQTGRHWMLPEVANINSDDHSVLYLLECRMTLSDMRILGMSVVGLPSVVRMSLSPHSFNYEELRLVHLH